MGGNLKWSRNNGASTISAWGSKFSGSFPTTVFTVASNGSVFPSTLNTSRDIVDKQKPSSGKARKNPDGWRAPTPFRSYVCRLVPGPAFTYWGRNSAGASVRHTGERGYNPALPQMSIYLGVAGTGRFPRTSQNTIDRATTEAMNKLSDTGANLGESIATLDQTLGLIASSASTMLSIYRALRGKQTKLQKRWDAAESVYRSLSPLVRRGVTRKQFLRRQGLPPKRPQVDPLRRGAGSAWLELHYGWKPLVSDISFAMDTLRNGLPKQKVTAIRNVQESHALPVKTGTVAPYNLITSGHITSGCKVRIDCSLTHPNLAALNGLGLLNPFQLGWELLPFSFVLDWLLPIGNALSAITTPFGLSLKAISTTRYTVASVGFSWTQYPTIESGQKITASVNSLATYRTVSFFWPIPRTYFKSPFTNLTRAVTALALLQQLR